MFEVKLKRFILWGMALASIYAIHSAHADTRELAELSKYENPFIATTVYRPGIANEVSLVLVIYTGTLEQYHDDGSEYYTEFSYKVPGLTYSQKHHEVIYTDANGVKTVCASESTSKIFGFSFTALVGTSACAPVLMKNDSTGQTILNYQVQN